MIRGQDRAVRAFLSAWRSGQMHHAWLLAGPKGVGKGRFARLAALRVLAEAAGPPIGDDGLTVPDDHRIARLVTAGSHPDLRLLERLERPTGGLARNITVDQVRSLGPLFSVTPSLSDWRVVIIDAADDMEAPAANALLKMLEEPPASTLFLLVTHAPGRLLPTIRSRCRRIDFSVLDDDALTSLLAEERPDLGEEERVRLVALAQGSARRALDFAALDLAPIEAEARTILLEGDPGNTRRAKLAAALGGKAAADRYAAFLELVPGLIARETRQMDGERRRRALDAYARARETAALAPRLSLDPAATVFQLGTILDRIARS